MPEIFFMVVDMVEEKKKEKTRENTRGERREYIPKMRN